MKNKHSRAFTYIELTVVVLVLALFAASIVPSLITWQQSQNDARFISDLSTIAVDARERAIRLNAPVALAYSDADSALVIRSADTEADEQILRRLPLPDGTTIDRYVQGDEESNASEWEVVFYPDGTTEGGGIETSVAGKLRSLEIQEGPGASRLLTEELPEPSQRRWEAGDYEQR